MSDEPTGKNQGHRWAKGKSGNPAGRPKGSRHAALLALDSIGAEAAEEIMKVAVGLAKGGDLRACELLLGRLWPPRKGRAVQFDLPPMKSPADLPAVLAAIVNAVTTGVLTPEEGRDVASMVEGQVRAFESAELERRIAALEQGRPSGWPSNH